MSKPEWITKTSEKIAQEGESQLLQIAEDAAARHGIAAVILPQDDAVRLACFLNEVQHQSFILGIQLAFGIVKDLAESQPPAS
jgi:hypothetical protein